MNWRVQWLDFFLPRLTPEARRNGLGHGGGGGSPPECYGWVAKKTSTYQCLIYIDSFIFQRSIHCATNDRCTFAIITYYMCDKFSKAQPLSYEYKIFCIQTNSLIFNANQNTDSSTGASFKGAPILAHLLYITPLRPPEANLMVYNWYTCTCKVRCKCNGLCEWFFWRNFLLLSTSCQDEARRVTLQVIPVHEAACFCPVRGARPK